MGRLPKDDNTITAAVITGEHNFDVPGFQAAFRGMTDVDAYPQALENFVADQGGVRDEYDVLVFYNFHRPAPDERTAAALESLGQTSQGIVVLHHALLAFPAWPRWSQICGIDDRTFGFHHDQAVRVQVADAAHPITAGLADWEMPDETYTMCNADEGQPHPADHRPHAEHANPGLDATVREGPCVLLPIGPRQRHICGSRLPHRAAPRHPLGRWSALAERLGGTAMRALVTVLQADGRRGKRLVDDWPEYTEAPKANEVKTRTIYSGVTNGTERNNMLGGNYSRPDHELPSNEGYQSVGEVIALGPEVSELSIGDLVFIGAHTGTQRSPAGHVEFVTIAEDDLVLKLPSDINPVHAALFGMGGVAMRSCRNADLRMGERLLIVGGAGCIGQMAAQIATVMGARVTVGDVAGRRLELARAIGAAEAVVDVSGDGWDRTSAKAPSTPSSTSRACPAWRTS